MKKTYTIFMKIRTAILSLTFTLIFGSAIFAQTGTCTVIQQPCNGDGLLYIQTTGLIPPITFLCSNNYWTQIVSNTTDITLYNQEFFTYITAFDAVDSITIQTGMLEPFQIDSINTMPAVCPNLGLATVTVNSGITPDYVEWYESGNYVGTGNPMSLQEGQYQVKVFYAGCYSNNYGSVEIYKMPVIYFNLSSVTASCTNGSASVNSISGGTPPYSYLWSNGATSPTITGLVQGNYHITVTDATGCSADQEIYVNQSVYIHPNMVITQSPTCLQNDGKIKTFGSGGVPPYTYQYNDGQTTQEAVNLLGGIYEVIATDVNGCFGGRDIYLSSSTPVAVTYSTTTSSCVAPTGTAVLSISGGTPPYNVIWNTYPVQTGINAINLAPGDYKFTVTDALGCTRTGIIKVHPISIINATAYSINPECPQTTGNVGIYCSGAAPFTFIWNTGQITQLISGVAPGFYSCLITDSNSCSVTKSKTMVLESPLNIGFVSTPASCIYSLDGSLLAIPTGGTQPYSYNWSNGSGSNPAVNLSTGWHSVTVTDANGCTKNKWSFVNNSGTSNSCYCTIEGVVYFDENSNCVADPDETGIRNIKIHLDPFGYAFTDENGQYSFKVPSGTYTISEIVKYTYPLTPSCPANNPTVLTVTASSGCNISHNFFNLQNPIHDAHIVTFNDNTPTPGEIYRQKLLITNDGTLPETDMLLNYYPDFQLPMMTTLPFSLQTTNNSLWYNSPSSISLEPGKSIVITNSFSLPVNIPAGTDLSFVDYVSFAPPITNWENDYTPWNNVNNFHTTVYGTSAKASGIPIPDGDFFIEVFPKGIGSDGTITLNDSILEYLIHFRNIVENFVENVTIIDTLDNDLDPSSVITGGASHPYTLEITENILKFKFTNIHLQSKKNLVTSTGFLTYTVKQKQGLTTGSKIENSASVFLDMHQPVWTGKVMNTISTTSGGTETADEARIHVYPNPVSDVLFLKYNQPVIALEVYDITGRSVLFGNASECKNKQLNVNDLPEGMYFILVYTNGEKLTSKFIKN